MLADMVMGGSGDLGLISAGGMPKTIRQHPILYSPVTRPERGFVGCVISVAAVATIGKILTPTRLATAFFRGYANWRSDAGDERSVFVGGGVFQMGNVSCYVC